MAVGTITAIAIGLAAAGAASAFSAASKKPSGGGALPQAPTVSVGDEQAEARKQAEARNRKRQVAMGRNKTVYTSPLGISGEAETTRKTLLGQ